jgi:hypothetical protein
MANRWSFAFRRIAPALTAGLLLQAEGCAFNLNETLAGVLSSIATSYITSFIFAALNLAPPVL